MGRFFGPFIRWFRSLHPKWQLVCIVMIMLGALYFILAGVRTTDQIAAVLLGPLERQGPQANATSHTLIESTAVEGSVLAALKSDEEWELPPLSKQKILDVVKALSKSHPASFDLTSLVEKRTWDGGFLDEEIVHGGSSCANGDPSSGAFLLVPGIAIRGVSAALPLKTRLTRSDNQEVVDSLELAKAACGAVEAIANVKSAKSRVVQSYLLLSTGVLLITQGTHQQENFYENQFNGHTFLPERPYFWPTIKNTPRERNSSDQDPDYQTEDTYFDLGGNGPIRTYCWGFTRFVLPTTVRAVACVDVAPTNSTSEISTIQRTVSALGASQIRQVDCLLSKGPEGKYGYSCPKDTTLTQDLSELNGEGALTVLGHVHILNGSSLPPRSVWTLLFRYVAKRMSIVSRIFDVRPSSLTFSVPTGIIPSAEPTLHLLVCSIDLESVEAKLALEAILGFGLTGVALTLGALFIIAGHQHDKDTERARDNISHVMKIVADAYAMADDKDVIINCNSAFRDLVGGHLELGKTRLKDDILDQDSANLDTYEKANDNRRAGKPSEYTIQLYNGKRCRASGAIVPAGRLTGMGLPFTFAVFIELGAIDWPAQNIDFVMSNIAEPYVMTNGKGKIVRTNQAFRDLIGKCDGDLAEVSFESLLEPCQTNLDAWNASREARRQGRYSYFHIELMDRRIFTVFEAIVPEGRKPASQCGFPPYTFAVLRSEKTDVQACGR